MGNIVEFWRGETSKLPSSKNENTLYFIRENENKDNINRKFYLGSDIIADVTADSDVFKPLKDGLTEQGNDLESLEVLKAQAAVLKSSTLTAEGWNTVDGVVSQTVSINGVTVANNIIVSLSKAATAEEILAAGTAMIRATAQNDGNITFTCLKKTMPEIDIPIEVLITDSLNLTDATINLSLNIGNGISSVAWKAVAVDGTETSGVLTASGNIMVPLKSQVTFTPIAIDGYGVNEYVDSYKANGPASFEFSASTVVLTITVGEGVQSVAWEAISPEGTQTTGTLTATGTINVPPQSQVTFTPTAKANYSIDAYTDSYIATTDASFSFTASTIVLTLNLGTGVSRVTWKAVAPTTSVQTSGTLTSSGTINVPKNATVTFAATAASSYTMDSYTTSYVATTNNTFSFTATYTPQVYVYIDTYYNGYSDSGCGYATVDGSSNYVTAYPGDYLSLDYGANDGFAFDYFDSDYGTISGSTFIVPDRDCNIYAYFEDSTDYSGNASKTGYNVSYSYGDEVTSALYAGGIFDSLPSGWYSGGETISGGYTVKTTNDYDSTVDEQYYPVSFSVSSSGNVIVGTDIPASREYSVSGFNFVENVYLNISGSWSV